MSFYDANVADILRCSQRDEQFVTELEEHVQNLLQLTGTRNLNELRRSVPVIAKIWYYLVTSLSNLQTLGEEYTGTIRVTGNNRLPTKFTQVLWLVLHVGGESMLDRFLTSMREKVSKSEHLTSNAKNCFLNTIDVLNEQKPTLKRIHHAIFYTNGKYYNIANRMTNIRYVLVRQWLEDDTFTGSFNFLGNISLFYILFNIVQQIWFTRYNSYKSDSPHNYSTSTSKKSCAICGENLKSASATPCGHIFCWTCIYDSLEYQKVCPICRRDVKHSRIVLLQNYL